MREVRSIIGVCPQTNVFWDNLTVREHVTLFADLRGLPARSETTRLVHDVGLGSKMDTLALHLSGGQKRCAVAHLLSLPATIEGHFNLSTYRFLLGNSRWPLHWQEILRLSS
jgi:ABC-type Na+ transport system ATPase subunit NatA